MKKPTEANVSNRIAGAVFAGGQSTRMGTDKAFLEIGGEPLLARQLRLLRASGISELLISGRSGTDYSLFDANIVHDLQPDVGPLGGLAASLTAVRRNMLLVLAVDLPAMTTQMLQAILAQTTQTVGCIPLDKDGLQPLAATYPKTALPLVRRQLQEGDLSVQNFAKQAIAQDLIRPLRISKSQSRCFVNWNRPSDWSTEKAGTT